MARKAQPKNTESPARAEIAVPAEIPVADAGNAQAPEGQTAEAEAAPAVSADAPTLPATDGAPDAPASNTPASEASEQGVAGTAAAPTPPAADGAAVQADRDKQAGGLVVIVTGPKKGRRRAGRSFGPEPVEIPVDELTEGEKRQLISDPMLTLTINGETFVRPATE